MARSLGNKTRSRKAKNGKTVRRKNEGIVVGRERERIYEFTGSRRLPRFRDGIFKRNRSRETAARTLCVTRKRTRAAEHFEAL